MLDCFETYLRLFGRNDTGFASLSGDVNCGGGFGHPRFPLIHGFENPLDRWRGRNGDVDGLTESLGGVAFHEDQSHSWSGLCFSQNLKRSTRVLGS